MPLPLGTIHSRYLQSAQRSSVIPWACSDDCQVLAATWMKPVDAGNRAKSGQMRPLAGCVASSSVSFPPCQEQPSSQEPWQADIRIQHSLLFASYKMFTPQPSFLVSLGNPVAPTRRHGSSAVFSSSLDPSQPIDDTLSLPRRNRPRCRHG